MAKVIGGFKCPYTKKIYHVGDEYDGDHLKEMQEKGYVEKMSTKVKGKNAAIAAQTEIDNTGETDFENEE